MGAGPSGPAPIATTSALLLLRVLVRARPRVRVRLLGQREDEHRLVAVVHATLVRTLRPRVRLGATVLPEETAQVAHAMTRSVQPERALAEQQVHAGVEAPRIGQRRH